MSGKTKTKLIEQVLEYFREMKEASLEQCKRALRPNESALKTAVKRLADRGALECLTTLGCRSSVYRFVKEPEQIGRLPELQHKAWRAMRMSKTFTAWDIALLSGMTYEYSKEYVRCLKSDGFIEQVGRESHNRILCRVKKQYCTNATPPQMWESTARKEQILQDAMSAGWQMMRDLRNGNMAAALGALASIEELLRKGKS